MRFYLASTSYVLAMRRLGYKQKVPLEGLNFEDSFVVVLVGGFEFSPAVDVHGVLELIFESFDFGLLVEEVLFLETDFGFQLINAPNLFLNTHELISLIGQICSEVVELFLFFLVIDFAFSEVRVGQFDFLVQDG